MDIGRHILAKGFGTVATDYNSIAIKLREDQVIDESVSRIMLVLAENRNRMVHY